MNPKPYARFHTHNNKKTNQWRTQSAASHKCSQPNATYFQFRPYIRHDRTSANLLTY